MANDEPKVGLRWRGRGRRSWVQWMAEFGGKYFPLRPHARKARHRNYSELHPGERRRRYRLRKQKRDANAQ